MITQTRTKDAITATATGRVATDITSSTTKTNKPMCRFRLAVDDGKGTQWVSVLCFGDTVEAAKNLHKDGRVQVFGRIELKSWTAQDGTSRSGLDLIANSVDALDTPQPVPSDLSFDFDEVPF